MIAQIPPFVKGNFDKTYEETVNVASLNDPGCGVGITALGAEEVNPFIRQFHNHFPAAGALAVHAGDDVCVRLDPDLFGLVNADQIGGELPVFTGRVGGKQAGEGDFA